MQQSPYEMVSKGLQNSYNSVKQSREQSALDDILAQAMSSNNPDVLQNTLGQILSKVAPDKQQAAFGIVQGKIGDIKKQQMEARQMESAQQSGYDPYAPDSVKVQQVKDRNKAQRLGQYYGNQNPNQSQDLEVNSLSNEPKNAQIPIAKMTNRDQLINLTGHPDREVSQPAIARLKQLQKDDEIKQGQNNALFKSDRSRSDKFKDETDKIAFTIPQKETALNLMDDAVVNKDLSFFTLDNLAELTGIEGFRSKEGAIFKTAAKEYFLGNLQRAGARPNQWIEQQIQDMLTKIGRSTAANLSVSRTLRNELDIDKERVRITEEISDRLRSEGDLSEGKLGSMVNKELSMYAENKQRELFNDLRAIKAIDENTPQKFKRVDDGGKPSTVMVQALLKQFNNDTEKAREEAKKLGYKF